MSIHLAECFLLYGTNRPAKTGTRLYYVRNGSSAKLAQRGEWDKHSHIWAIREAGRNAHIWGIVKPLYCMSTNGASTVAHGKGGGNRSPFRNLVMERAWKPQGFSNPSSRGCAKKFVCTSANNKISLPCLACLQLQARSITGVLLASRAVEVTLGWSVSSWQLRYNRAGRFSELRAQDEEELRDASTL